MKTLFVCLANSQKFGGRCVAGVKITMPTESSYEIEREGILPLWIRPVMNSANGELSEQLVKHIRLLEIFEIDIIKNVPNGHQTENVLFETESLKKINRIEQNVENLNHFSHWQPEDLFGNTSNAIAATDISDVSYSLVFIKIDNCSFYTSIYEKIRVKFNYKGHLYDLPVTDKVFNGNFIKNNNFYVDNFIYLTISLGVEFSGYYYKLVSGVIVVPW